MNRHIVNTITSALPIVAAQRQMRRAASSRILGFGPLVRPRRSSSGLWIAAGVAIAGAAAALLVPSRRKGLLEMFQRAGGGIGKQAGKLLGQTAGAHPKKTAELFRETRDFMNSREHSTM